ncbi:MAG: hypothetical protein EHM51_02450, partial [Geobacter sp.]
MKRTTRLTGMMVSVLCLTALICGCGSSKKEGAADPVSAAAFVGSVSCTNNCHAQTLDITGTPIFAAWTSTTHTRIAGVQCE